VYLIVWNRHEVRALRHIYFFPAATPGHLCVLTIKECLCSDLKTRAGAKAFPQQQTALVRLSKEFHKIHVGATLQWHNRRNRFLPPSSAPTDPQYLLLWSHKPAFTSLAAEATLRGMLFSYIYNYLGLQRSWVVSW
jgi:hypothetical protein